jgi:SH3 domain protein
MKKFLFALAACAMISGAMAETRYVSDVLQIQLRSGPGTQYRIIKSLQTGSALQLTDSASENGYVQVSIDGTTGWVASQYLMREPSARQQLSKLQRELEMLKANASPTQARLMELEQENQQLKNQLSETEAQLANTSSELDRITELSGKAVELDQSNSRLRLENSNLINEMDILRIENTRLKEQDSRDFMLYGAFAVLLGVIIALIVPHLTAKKKHSEWF